MAKTIVPKLVVGAVVVRDGKVLILQRHNNEKTFPGLWELPSGKKEPLETLEQALSRELTEETGLNLINGRPFSTFNYTIEKEDEIRDSTQVNFLVAASGNVTLSAEHQAYAWLAIGELPKYEMSKQVKAVVEEAIKM